MKQKKFSLATVHIVLIVLSLIFVSPLLWMVTTAIKPIEETMTATPTLLPSKFLWDNFPKAVTYGSKELGYIPFLLYLTGHSALCCRVRLLQCRGRICLCPPPLARPGFLLCRDACDHDGPLPRLNGPDIWPLQVAGLGGFLPPALGTSVLWKRFLDLFAPSVL